jgi:hypothetical protein
MTGYLVLLALLVIALLAPRFGVDSREDQLDVARRDALWSRSGVPRIP